MENFDSSDYSINYETIANYDGLTNVTRVLALDLMKNPYMVVGDFFKNLSNASLNELLDLIDKDDEDSLAEMLLLSEMLSRAEGLENTVEDFAKNLDWFKVFVSCTHLHRAGRVKTHFENISFGEEVGDRVLIERINNDD